MCFRTALISFILHPFSPICQSPNVCTSNWSKSVLKLTFIAFTVNHLLYFILRTLSAKIERYNGCKDCPHRTLDDYGWDYFLNLVKSYMNQPSEPEKKTLYRVQVGAFKSKANADAYAKKADAAGFNGAFVTQGSNGLYKVQVGAFSNKANADAYAEKAEKAGFKGAFIVEK